jgi:hypothetical protein
VDELAAMARTRLGQFGLGNQELSQGYQQPPGFQQPRGFRPPPTPPPPPDYSASAPPPGYTGQQRPSRWASGSSSSNSAQSSSSSSRDDSIEDAVADLVMGAATSFIGRAIGSRVKRAYGEPVVPAMAANGEAMLREQIAIAGRYPDLRACLTDNVVFLAGGSRVVPMSSLSRGFTLEQADAVVAQLRNG